jgi:D-3-phosphoglycerate dehydrogenase
MTVPRVLITATGFRERAPEAWQLLEESGFDIVETPVDRPLLHEEIAQLAADVEAAIVGVDPWDARAFDSTPRLRVIARFGVGLDNIDLAEAERRGILVGNVPGANAPAVAELTVLLILAQIRTLIPVALATQEARWTRPLGRDLGGETVGLVGFGDIGRRVARIARSFDASVIAYDPFADAAKAAELGVEIVALHDLLARATVVSLHLPATPETHHIVNADFLGRMRPEALLINTARGALVDSVALATAVRQGRIAGAAVDVYEHEPVRQDDPLLGVDGIIATPHVAAETADTYRRTGMATARIVVDGLARPSATETTK